MSPRTVIVLLVLVFVAGWGVGLLSYHLFGQHRYAAAPQLPPPDVKVVLEQQPNCGLIHLTPTARFSV
jgi:hypothetical protein